ncbi:hypothetical protein SMG44B_10535 [Stenotrophomonas maltophilia]
MGGRTGVRVALPGTPYTHPSLRPQRTRGDGPRTFANANLSHLQPILTPSCPLPPF